MRVFSAVLATETNTFSPIPTGMAAFTTEAFYPAGSHPDHMTPYGGQLWAARARAKAEGWTVFEGLAASAQPGGPATRKTYETLRDRLIADLEAVVPVDMVLLALHGAMVAEGYDDCEGDILSRVRTLVGDRTVVGAAIDPHCHLTQAMTEAATLIVAYKEYPHTDILETGEILVDLCARTARGEIDPRPVMVDTGMISLVRTTTEPGRSLVARARAFEREAGVLSVSIAQGFPWADVAEMGSKVLVYGDGERETAAKVAATMARELFDSRLELSPSLPACDEALDLALAGPAPVIVADVSDNPGGGAAGDSTFFLEAALRRNIEGIVIGPLWDPVAAQFSFDAGEGARLPIRIGGKVGPLSGTPIDAVWHVLAVSDDHVVPGLGDVPLSMGTCALLECNGVELVVCSHRSQAFHPDLFERLGCRLSGRKIVVVKSTQHFRSGFEPIAGSIIYAASPGSVSPDFSRLPYSKVDRSRWPLDPGQP